MVTETIRTIPLDTDFCVVGGGMAGVCAAVAAARHGAKTVLVQDRPMLGGNASSEIRMWICGAVGTNVKESGILEEIQLENLRWNPSLHYNIWDHILMNFVQRQENLTLLLNCSCDGVHTEDSRIVSITAWQLTTQKRFEIRAKYYADCSGDSILRYSGAEFRCGREAKSEFNESHAQDTADNKTMGNSILFQTKDSNRHDPFEAPPWAHVFQEKGFHRPLLIRDNFWWMEYGGELDTIADSEEIRDELLKIAYGVWSLCKNSRKGIGRDYDLEWIGVLPGKRENIRYVGDYILTQNDIEKQGRFDDIVAYGGWPFDDHVPAAFYYKGNPNTFHSTPCNYGIPFRALYSRNISNLYFAGRNISCTHMAMSSTRVMGTCSVVGQAVGTAAAIGVRDELDPREIYENRMAELQNTLMDDDCWLPGHAFPVPDLTTRAHLQAESDCDAELLRDGKYRDSAEGNEYFTAEFGSYIEYHFKKPTFVSEVKLVFDSNLRDMAAKRMRCYYPADGISAEMPEELIKEFAVKVQTAGEDSPWEEIVYCEDNCKRLVRIPVGKKVTAVRFIPEASWGLDEARIFAFELA